MGAVPPVYLSFIRGKGSGVTRVEGLRISESEKNALLKAFKKRLGCGGTIKNGNLELQGDRRDLLENEFKTKGLPVKRKGG